MCMCMCVCLCVCVLMYVCMLMCLGGCPDHIRGRAGSHVHILNRRQKNIRNRGESAGMNVKVCMNVIVSVCVMFDVACADSSCCN